VRPARDVWNIGVLPGACGLVFGLLGLVSLKAALTAG